MINLLRIFFNYAESVHSIKISAPIWKLESDKSWVSGVIESESENSSFCGLSSLCPAPNFNDNQAFHIARWFANMNWKEKKNEFFDKKSLFWVIYAQYSQRYYFEMFINTRIVNG